MPSENSVKVVQKFVASIDAKCSPAVQELQQQISKIRAKTRCKMIDVPKEFAKRLELDTRNYSFHSFRRSAATIAIENGLSESLLQQAGRWKNASSTTHYVMNSNVAKKAIASSVSLG